MTGFHFVRHEQRGDEQMGEVLITSSFVLTKPESSDNTIVSTSEWNGPKLITGGSPGQVLVRDTTSSTGASWIDGAAVQRVSDAFTGSATTTPGMALTIVTCASNAYVTVQPHVNLVLAVGNAAVMSIRRNGTVIVTGAMRGDGAFYQPFSWVFSESPGTYNYDLLFSGTSGAITSASAVLTATKVGRL
jgi:hypothetical protein